jgi:hypothetical protein
MALINVPSDVTVLTYIAIVGSAGGLITGLFLIKRGVVLRERRLWLLAAGWGSGLPIGLTAPYFLDFTPSVSWGLMGLVVGTSTGIVVAAEKQANRIWMISIITAIWVLSCLGAIFYNGFLERIFQPEDFLSLSLLMFTTGVLLGGIGGFGTLLAVKGKVSKARTL